MTYYLKDNRLRIPSSQSVELSQEQRRCDFKCLLYGWIHMATTNVLITISEWRHREHAVLSKRCQGAACARSLSVNMMRMNVMTEKHSDNDPIRSCLQLLRGLVSEVLSKLLSVIRP